MQRCAVANEGWEWFFFFVLFCCCRFTKEKSVKFYLKVFSNNSFWPLCGYDLTARWGLSSTTKAGFKIIAEPCHTNIPVHTPAHPPTHRHTHLSVCWTWLSDRSLLEQILQDLCTTADKQEHLRHVGRRNKHGWALEELSVILSLCNTAVAALGMPVAHG